MPTLFNFRGYTRPDPLDKASRPYLLLIGVNGLLTLGLLCLITHYKIVYFQGFGLFGHSFPPIATETLEVLINCFLFSPLIVLVRKCSSLLPFLLVLLPYFLLDLYIESHYRVFPEYQYKALWMYYSNSFVGATKPTILKFIITLSVDAILFGIIGLYLARLAASVIYRTKPYAPRPTKEQFQDLFRREWSQEVVKRPHRDACFYILRLLGVGYLLYLLILVMGLLGAAPWPDSVGTLITMTYRNPALAVHTYFKITLMVMLAFTGAYNSSLRFYCGLGLFAGHLVSTGYSFIFHYVGSLNASDSPFLLVSGLLDGVMILIFGWIIVRYRKEGSEFAPLDISPIDYSLPMTLQQYLYRAMGYFFAATVVFIVCIRLWGKGRPGISAIFHEPDPMIGNTITLYGTLSVLAFLQVKREQLRKYLFNSLTVPLLFGSLAALVWLLTGRLSHDEAWFFVLYACVGLLISGLLIGLRKMFYRADYSINSIDPSAAIDCLALLHAFYDADDREGPQVLQAIDSYVGGIRGRKRGLLNLPFGLFENVLNFIYGFHPPFSAMSRNEQRYYLRAYFLRDGMERRESMLPPLAELGYMIGISLNSMISFAHFSNINARYKIGYVPVDARDRTQGDCAAYDPPHEKVADLPKDHLDPHNFKPFSNCSYGPLIAPRVTTPVKEDTVPDEVDYIILGSGAGGATAAYRLISELGPSARILVVERGNRWQPLQDFQDNEMVMMMKLYKEGGLQQTKQFTMTLAQGECVGGTTVINNAVCFKMPDNIKAEWQNKYGIDLSGLEAEYARLEEELHIAPLDGKGVNRISRALFEKGVAGVNGGLPATDQLNTEYPVHVNHRNTTGDGNWNLGNKRMQKRSMLETFLPWSEARGVKIVSNLMAARFVAGDNGRAKEVHLLNTDGTLVRVKVKKAVLVAGGAVASSHFLMRSGVPNANVGKALSCNFAFPVTLDFDLTAADLNDVDPSKGIRAYDGDQITMAALDPRQRAAFETYFNPPATFSITSVPFFFDRRDAVMDRYKHLLNLGTLVGSEARGVVLPKADLFNGQAFSWELGDTDIANIKYALSTLVQIGRHAGATKAILPTRPGIELDLRKPGSEAEFIKALKDYPLQITDLLIGSAHPQGGNLMAGAKGVNAGIGRVVDETFRVEGYENVFVVDASIFPTSITVNPQWTIMALSSLAVKSVLKYCR